MHVDAAAPEAPGSAAPEAPLAAAASSKKSLAQPAGIGDADQGQLPKSDGSAQGPIGGDKTAALDHRNLERQSSTGAAPIAGGHVTTPIGIDTPGSTVSVTFLPNATAPDILAFLERYNLMIADGPSPQGAYRIRLSSVQLPKGLVAQFIRSMREETKIVKDVTE